MDDISVGRQKEEKEEERKDDEEEEEEDDDDDDDEDEDEVEGSTQPTGDEGAPRWTRKHPMKAEEKKNVNQMLRQTPKKKRTR